MLSQLYDIKALTLKALNQEIKHWLSQCQTLSQTHLSLDMFVANLATAEQLKDAPHTAKFGRFVTLKDIESIDESDWRYARVSFTLESKLSEYWIRKENLCAVAAPNHKQHLYSTKTLAPGLVGCYYAPKYESQHQNLWTLNIGMNSKAEAENTQFFLWENQLASHSIIRKGTRTNYPWEVKAWHINQQYLEACLLAANF